MSSKLLVSVVQSCPPLTPTSAPQGSGPSAEEVLNLTLEKLDSLVSEVRRQGSGFAVFPEAFIGGYPKFATFGATIGDRQPSGRDEYLSYWSGAIPLPRTSSLPIPLSSPILSQYTALKRVLESSAKYGVFLVLGVIERDGGTLYCTLLSVHPKEGLVGKRRKLMPTGSERIVWGQGQPEGMNVESVKVRRGAVGKRVGSGEGADGQSELHADGAGPATAEGEDEEVEVRVSKAVCWENYMPLLRTHFYTQNTQLYCAPTVDSRPVWQHSMAHIALEGRCYVLSACQFSTQSNYAPSHPLGPGQEKDPNGIVIAGGSVIISPSGEVLAGPLRGREGVITAEVDLGECVRGKMDLDVAGHYARPDVFELVVHAK